MWIKDFARTHPDVIVRGAVPYSEIAERLKEQYGAVEFPLAEVPSMRMHRYNALNLPSNEALRVTEEQLQFSAIKIPITDKSSLYTAKDFVPVVGLDGKEFIYLVTKSSYATIIPTVIDCFWKSLFLAVFREQISKMKQRIT